MVTQAEDRLGGSSKPSNGTRQNAALTGKWTVRSPLWLGEASGVDEEKGRGHVSGGARSGFCLTWCNPEFPRTPGPENRPVIHRPTPRINCLCVNKQFLACILHIQ